MYEKGAFFQVLHEFDKRQVVHHQDSRCIFQQSKFNLTLFICSMIPDNAIVLYSSMFPFSNKEINLRYGHKISFTFCTITKQDPQKNLNILLIGLSKLKIQSCFYQQTKAKATLKINGIVYHILCYCKNGIDFCETHNFSKFKLLITLR